MVLHHSPNPQGQHQGHRTQTIQKAGGLEPLSREREEGDGRVQPHSPLFTPALSQQEPAALRITLQFKVEVPGRTPGIIGCEMQIHLAASPLFTWPSSLPVGEKYFSVVFFFFLFLFPNIWTFVETVRPCESWPLIVTAPALFSYPESPSLGWGCGAYH